MPVKRNSGGDEAKWPYSPPTEPVSNAQGINHEVVGIADTMNSTGAPNDSQDNGGNGAFFNADLLESGPFENDAIVAIYGVETHVSDTNEFSSGNSFDVWWFNREWNDPGGWVRNLEDDDFLAYHELSKSATDVVSFGDPNTLRTDFIGRYGMPVLNWTGDLTVLWEYTGGGDDGECAFSVWYEYIPVHEDQLMRELLGRS